MIRRKAERDVPVPVPEHAVREDGRIAVWRTDTDTTEWVTVPEAARGMIAWGRQAHGEGTPGFAVVVQQAIALLAEHGFTPAGQQIRTGEQGND